MKMLLMVFMMAVVMMMMNFDLQEVQAACPSECVLKMGNLRCDDECNIPDCSYDGYDCATISPTTPYPTFSPNPPTPNPTLPPGVTPGYTIQLYFVTEVPIAIQQTFEAAKAKWESVIK